LDSQSQSYLLRVGDADRERLEVLASIYDPGSQDFLQRHLPAQARTLIDLGCGHGQLTCWMAKAFSRAWVYGLDLSDEQLSICEQNRVALDVPNVSFHRHDVLDPAPDIPQADAVYCRYLLLHLREWDTFFHNVLALCKPGGSLLIEEPGFPFFCYPRHEALDRANALGQALTSRMGLRFDCIDPLWRYVHALDSVRVKAYSFSQPILATDRQKSLLWRSFTQIHQPLVSMGLCTGQEADSILAQLAHIAGDPLYVVGTLRMVQLHLVKL